MLVLVYAYLLFLVLRFSVTLFNFLSNPKLGYYARHYRDKVSVVFLDYEDVHDAAGIAHDLGYEHLQVLFSGRGVPERTLADDIAGDYVLVLEPGVSLTKGAVESLIFRIRTFKLGMVAVLPDRMLQTFAHYLFLPFADFTLVNLFPLKLISMVDSPAISLPVTGCRFYAAGVYRAYLESLPEDGAPLPQDAVRLTKQLGFRAEVLLANGFVKHRSESLQRCLNG